LINNVSKKNIEIPRNQTKGTSNSKSKRQDNYMK